MDVEKSVGPQERRVRDTVHILESSFLTSFLFFFPFPFWKTKKQTNQILNNNLPFTFLCLSQITLILQGTILFSSWFFLKVIYLARKNLLLNFFFSFHFLYLFLCPSQFLFYFNSSAYLFFFSMGNILHCFFFFFPILFLSDHYSSSFLLLTPFGHLFPFSLSQFNLSWHCVTTFCYF